MERAKIRRFSKIFRPLESMELHVWPLTISSRSLLVDAISSNLTKTGMPGGAAMIFPIDVALGALQYGSARLPQSAPLLYQEYDRLRSEVELRVAIAPGLVCLATVLPFGSRPLIVSLAAMIGIVILIQAAQKYRLSHGILANCYYQKYVDFPIVEALQESIALLDPKPKSEATWMAAMVSILFNRGFFDEASTCLGDMHREGLPAQAQEKVKQYLEVNCPELADSWRAEISAGGVKKISSAQNSSVANESL
ncbi:hypothetical protein [Amycolatopsis sp. NPDC050768]|uniref:hypothetical protein n=1 Tax=Amycolatopsis sp. NPDC050768 TaxID=3154839 RepID=UPI0033D249FB